VDRASGSLDALARQEGAIAMSPEDDSPKIQIDDDWKAEAQREKERLTKEEEQAGDLPPLPEPTFAEIVNMLLMQALIGLGGFTTPDGRRLAPDLDVARHHIDLLEVLERKTQGNLEEEEQTLLSTALYEMRMRFVQALEAAQKKS
jgi:hypothetical protein